MLWQKIDQDLLAALKNKDGFSVSLIRMVKAAFLRKEKEKRLSLFRKTPDLTESELGEKSSLSDEEAVEIIFSEVKKREEASGQFIIGKRFDLAEKEKKEAEYLKKYLPSPLPEEDIVEMAKEAISEVGAKDKKDIGRVMAKLTLKTKNRASGEIVSRIVADLIGDG